MSDYIFGAIAPMYYAKGIAVIPLRPKTKIPAIKAYQNYAEKLPTADEQRVFIDTYPNGNIGVVTGPASGLSFIDIDTDDELAIQAILSVLPESPWKRVGKKGMVLAYKYNPKVNKAHRLYPKDAENPLVEVFSSKVQIVLPPSIHPETNEAYSANCNLYDVVDKLPIMPATIVSDLEDALKKVGIELSKPSQTPSLLDKVPLGQRDVTMNRLAGSLGTKVRMGQLSLKQAFTELQVWNEMKVQVVDGDTLDINKGYNQIVQYLIRDVKDKGKILSPGWDEDLTKEEIDLWGLNFNEDQKDWPYEEAIDFLKEKFNTDDSAQKQIAIETMLRKIAHSNTLKSTEIDRILNYIKSQSGDNVQISTYRKRIKELRLGDAIAGNSHDEIADAFIKEYTEKLGKVVSYNHAFWTWNGSHWEQVSKEEIFSYISTNFSQYDLGKTKSNIDQIMSTALMKNAQKSLNTTGERFVNMANGVLDSNGKLQPHDPKWGATYTFPFSYDEEKAGKAAKFYDFLKYSWGHNPDFEDKVQAFREALCATIFGKATEFQKVFLLKGKPGTGKSQLLEIVQNLVPDEGKSNVDPKRWGELNLLGELDGKIINVIPEIGEKDRYEGSIFKTVVVGEPVQARKLYKDPFTFRPQCAHWFCGNYLPKSSDVTHAFVRRWLIFEFDRVVEEKDKILDYWKQIIFEEREAIIAWVVQVLPDLKAKSSYTLPESHKRLTEELQGDINSVYYFLSHCEDLKFGVDKKIKIDKLYSRYNTFMMLKNMNEMSEKMFLKNLWDFDHQYKLRIENDTVHGVST